MIKIFDLIGRVFISGVFLLSGFSKIGNYDGTVGWMESFGLPGFLLIPAIILEILGPVECYYERIRNKFRMQIILKSYKSVDPNGDKINKYINENLSNWNSIKYSDTKINIDINPASLL